MKKAVVWKVNGLGDFVTFLPTLHKIISIHGIDNVLFVLSPVSFEVLKIFYTPVHYLVISRNEFIGLYKHPLKLLRFTRKVKKFSAHRAYFNFDECSSAYIISFLAGINERIGYDSKIAFAQKLLTKKIKINFDQNVYEIHDELINQELLTSELDLDQNYNKQNIYLQKGELFSSKGEPYIVLHPFAQFDYKAWSFKNYCDLAAMIESRLGIKTVIIGEKKHSHMFRNYSFAYSLDNDISALFELIRHSYLYIGNNSGPLHFAIITNTPFVLIEGPSPENWVPVELSQKYVRIRNRQIACAPCETICDVPMKCNNYHDPNVCLTSISVDEVFKNVKQLFESL